MAAVSRRGKRRSEAPEKPPSPQAFYRQALTEAEQLELPAAAELQGLDEEIAVLRVKLLSALRAHPEDLRLAATGVSMLVKAVAAQYRLSPKARRDLADHFAAALNSLGDQLLPTDR